MPVIEGAYRTVVVSGVPTTGTNAVQTITFSGTVVSSGTFILSLGGWPTAPITGNATPATMVSAIDAALEGLPNVGPGGVTTAVGTYAAGAGTITCTFTGVNAGSRPMDVMVVENNSLVGAPAPTIGIATTTAGVRPSYPGAPRGASVVNSVTGIYYSNTGPPEAQVWTVIGAQT